LATGRPLWTEEGFGCAAIILAEGRLHLIDERGRLTIAPASPAGFRPSAQARILSTTTRASPALSGGRLYARDDRELVAIDLRASAKP
jgi:hypothetical protein